jgi:hypothetical protein
MATYNKFQDFSEQLTLGIHDWDTHVFKVALTNTIPTAGMDELADITQISGTNGYTTGGTATTIGVSETTGTTTVTGTQVVFTASGGAMGTFQYYVLYNDTSTGDKLVAWWDHGSAVNLADGESFTIKFNNASPGTIFTLV